MIAELEAMRKQHMFIAFIVDDNLIGNKVAVKPLLRDVAAWQAAHGYPFTFFTEASLNLAEDDELMELMIAVNIATVFIGIESPNEESLRETKKFQNVHKGGTMVDRVRKVQDSGLEVWCGMIVGFDHDDARIFKAQYEFLRETDIMHAMVGMLAAIPKTPLHARLKNEGRLDLADELAYGTNVIPLGMTREELRDGYIGLMRDLYDADFYFERLENLFITRAARFLPRPQCLLAPTPVAEMAVAVGRRGASDRPVCPPDEECSRPGVAAGLSAPDDDDAPPPAGSDPVVHLRGQVRDALPPLHDVAPDGRTANAGEHVLVS